MKSVRVANVLLFAGVVFALPLRSQTPEPLVTIQADSAEAARLRLAAAGAPTAYTRDPLPRHFGTVGALRADNTPDTNPLTDPGATLGRFLFYDTRLSRDNTMSCGTCHLQSHNFSDPNARSRGIDGDLGDRHAMSVANLRYYVRGRMFWDERAATLEEAVLEPITMRVELGNSVEKVVADFGGDPSYAPLFSAAFGSAEVDRDRIAKALAQFLRSIVSFRAPYDAGMAQRDDVRDDFPNYTAEENEGKRVFVSSCARCHLPVGQIAHFNIERPSSNGIDADLGGVDGGVGDLTLRSREMGTFKSQGLRNIEVSGPYMHDGRFRTLEEVVDHYSDGVKAHPNLGGDALRRFNFDAREKKGLVAFLKTLTDPAFLADRRYSNPYEVAHVPDTAVASSDPAGRPMTIAEISSWVESFDADKDGKLSFGETAALYPTLAEQGLMDGIRGNRFGYAIDPRIIRMPSVGQTLTNRAAYLQGGFSRLDRDRNGELDGTEAAAFPRLVSEGDSSRDGRLDQVELAELTVRWQHETIPSELVPVFSKGILAGTPEAELVAADHDGDGAIGRHEAQGPLADLVEQGDRNDDGRLDKAEIRELEVDRAVNRMIDQSGFDGLHAARINRAFSSIGLPEDKIRQVIEMFKAERQAREEESESRRKTLLADLRAALGDEWWPKFEQVFLTQSSSQYAPIRRRGDTRPTSPRDFAAWALGYFDTDTDRVLSSDERHQFVIRLASVPGGIHVAEPHRAPNLEIDVEGVVARMLSFDANGDGRVGRRELPDRLASLLAAGDKDGGLELDAAEIRALIADNTLAILRVERPADATPLSGEFVFGAFNRGRAETRFQMALDQLDLPVDVRERASALVPPVYNPADLRARRVAMLRRVEEVIGSDLFRKFKENLADQDVVPDLPAVPEFIGP